MSEDKNYSILNLDGASDVIIKMLVMIENAVGWIGAPKGAKKDFNEGLAIYKESIEKNDTLSGLEKGAKISNARMELKQYINQGKIISNAFKNLQNEAKMNVEDDWLLVFFEYAKSAEEKGWKVIIAGAGMAAHLPGMCAAIFPMPVIGIPMHTTSLGGRDSLYSIVQMPSGIPVATVAINGGANAGLLAAKILATSDEELLGRLKEYSKKLKEQVEAKDARLQQVGYKDY